MQQLLEFLNRIRPLSPELIMHLQTILKCSSYKKREWLHTKEKVCRNIWFIEKGVLGSFYEHNGKQSCAWFMMEGDVMTVVRSFFDQVKSYESIQALEDTTVWYITYDELMYIYNHFPEFEHHGRVLTEKYYKLSEERLYLLHNQTASQKYAYLMEHFPHIIQRISNTHIASYLGITIQRLSEIKGKNSQSSRN